MLFTYSSLIDVLSGAWVDTPCGDFDTVRSSNKMGLSSALLCKLIMDWE
jgi:hypothetical protein